MEMGNINASVDLRRDGEIAIITADNPPVNALKHEVRAGLTEALRRTREDAAIKGVVIACAGRTFFAGADITEFGKPPQAPGLGEVITSIEAMPKPVVAALHGTAFGGGFELALACHFRVAVAGARVGLPEVKLGLLPGAGGTQRLPRLIGPEKALKMIVTGDPIEAREALADGVVDEIVEGDLTAGAVTFARRVVAESRPLRLLRDREEKLVAEGFADAAETLTRRLRGRDAPAACVEAVRNAITLPFEEGLKREGELFRKLVAGDQSKAQRHIFFAEREAARVPGIPEGTRPRPIALGAVIGAGTMGGGIAMCFANAGIPVTIVETGRDLLQGGLDRVVANYRATVSRGGLAADEMERRMALISGVTELDAVGSADVVIEAVFEEMDLKKRVFANLDRVAKADAVLATTPRHSMSTRSRGRPRGRQTCSACISSARRTSCDCWRSYAGRRPHRMPSPPRSLSPGGSARCRSPSACATGLSATACSRVARSKRSACCSKARCRKRSMPRSPGSAFRWGHLRWPIWQGSMSVGASAKGAASATRSRTHCARPAISARRPARDIFAMNPARAPRCPIPRSSASSPRPRPGSTVRGDRSRKRRSSSA